MKNCFYSMLWGFLFLVLPIFTAQSTELPPHPPELSADMVMYNKNKVLDEGKFYVGKEVARMDMQKKMNQTSIIRFNADKIEVWMHKNKMIMEMKMQYNALVNYKPEGFSETCDGTETIDGHPCDKCKVTGKFLGKKVETTIWKAKDLQGLVIKNMNDEGSGNEIKNIALGPQPESLFVAPPDYKKMEIPGGLGDIMKGLSH